MTFTLARVQVICLMAGVFLGLIGPLGSSALPLVYRLGYWIVAMTGGGLLGWSATRLVQAWMPKANRWLAILATASLMTPPGAVLIWLWGMAALPGQATLVGPLQSLGPMFVISLATTAVNHLILTHPAADPQTPAAAPPAPSIAPAAPKTAAEDVKSALADRLPPRLRGAAIHAVEAEDHYLRVHTRAGSDLILLRLADALAELSPLDGARTHRSWWVARPAVASVRRHDGRATLTLVNGLEVPVSRAHAPALRQAGWF